MKRFESFEQFQEWAHRTFPPPAMPKARPEMRESVVERVARALARRHYAVRFGLSPDHPQVQMNVDGNWQIFVEDAVTAIEAMREPTAEMWHAPAMEDATVHGVLPTGEEAEAIWRVMLDAALGGNP